MESVFRQDKIIHCHPASDVSALRAEEEDRHRPGTRRDSEINGQMTRDSGTKRIRRAGRAIAEQNAQDAGGAVTRFGIARESVTARSEVERLFAVIIESAPAGRHFQRVLPAADQRRVSLNRRPAFNRNREQCPAAGIASLKTRIDDLR